MTTQVIFNIDKKVKERAMTRAKSEGTTLSTFLTFATKAYAERDLSIGIEKSDKLGPKARRMIERELEEMKAEKNISPFFQSEKEAIAYLDTV